MTIKYCRYCDTTKPLTEFYTHTVRGHQSKCKVCSAKRALEQQRTPQGRKKKLEGHRRRKYGITQADWDAILEAQQGTCAICDQSERLVLDHCHDTGQVRGILCQPCNMGLGGFKDSVDNLSKAIQYLKNKET